MKIAAQANSSSRGGRSVPPGARVAAAHASTSTVSAAAVRVAETLVDLGPSRIADIAEALGSSSAAVSKHLEHLDAAGWVSSGDRGAYGPAAVAPAFRRRGRPARVWSLTAHGADQIATMTATADASAQLTLAAMRYVQELAGEAGVQEILRRHMRTAADRWRARSTGTAADLTAALAKDGYAASAVELADGSVQVCQHRCPIHEVAQEFPVACDIEAQAMSEVLGTNVVRLATIAAGGPICTTIVPCRRQQPPASRSHTHERGGAL